MLTTLEGVFKDGRIELREDPPAVEQARVIVTFLPHETPSSVAPAEANQRMLELLRSWRDDPLSPEEAQVLDDFDEFQARHPLRIARLDSEQ